MENTDTYAIIGGLGKDGKLQAGATVENLIVCNKQNAELLSGAMKRLIIPYDSYEETQGFQLSTGDTYDGKKWIKAASPEEDTDDETQSL